jgi:hypothetical protein
MILAGLLTALGCERSESPSTTSSNRNMPNAPSTTPAPRDTTRNTVPDTMRETRDQQLSLWRRQLDDNKIKVDALRVRAANAADAIKSDLQSGVSRLEDQIDAIQHRLDTFKDTSVSTWESSKSDVENLFTRFNDDMRALEARLNNPPPPPAPVPTPIPTPEPQPTPPPTDPGPGPG